MALLRGRTALSALGVYAALGLILSAAACASTGSAEFGGAGAAEVGSAHAGRYDDLFPDDRVQTVRIVMNPADWESFQRSALLENYYRADIWIDDELVRDVAVRAKGNSSLQQVASTGSNRVGLKVDLNFFNAARAYHGVRKLNYNNGFSDPTLMKEFLGYELMAAMGIPTPRACFVDLWVNDTHMGVYTQVEQVDAHFLEENFADGDGNLYKPELVAGGLDWTEEDVSAADATGQAGSATTSTTPSVNVGGGNLDEIISRLGDEAGWIPGRLETTEGERTTQTTAGPRQGGGLAGPPGPGPLGPMMGGSDYLTSVGLKTNEDSPDYSGLFELLAVLNSESSEVTAQDLEAILEVDEVLRFLAASVALVHLDNYIGMGHNYYLYEDGSKFWIIPWDLNMAFGGFDAGLSRDQILDFYIDEPTAATMEEYPLVEQLLSKPEYLSTYHGYLRELIDGPFSVERMTARIEEIASLIRPYVEADENLLFSLEAFEQGLREDVSSGAARVRTMGGSFIGLAAFVEARTASIAAQLAGQRAAGSGDGSGNGGRKGLGGLLGPFGGGMNGPPRMQPPAPPAAPSDGLLPQGGR